MSSYVNFTELHCFWERLLGISDRAALRMKHKLQLVMKDDEDKRNSSLLSKSYIMGEIAQAVKQAEGHLVKQ